MSDDTWYERNKEKAKAAAKAYREANKEKFKAYFKEYYQAHKDKLRERHKLWARENRDRLHALNREVYRPRAKARRQALQIDPLPRGRPPLPITPLPPPPPPLVIERGTISVTFD